MKTTSTIIQKATKLGQEAFMSGKTKAPYYDDSLMALIASELGWESGKASAMRCKVMDAWTAAWVLESLK